MTGSDVDNDPASLTYAVASQPQHNGAATDNGDGILHLHRRMPISTATDSFTVHRESDGALDSDTGHRSPMSVTAVNDAPVATPARA